LISLTWKGDEKRTQKLKRPFCGTRSDAGLPDGAFSNKKIPIWVNFGGFLQWKMLVCILFGHLVYFTASWYIVRPFGIFYGYLVYIFQFWYFVPSKIWQPWSDAAVAPAQT
jgi:hypothetical protein